jgi:hypothetical protein
LLQLYIPKSALIDYNCQKYLINYNAQSSEYPLSEYSGSYDFNILSKKTTNNSNKSNERHFTRLRNSSENLKTHFYTCSESKDWSPITIHDYTNMIPHEGLTANDITLNLLLNGNSPTEDLCNYTSYLNIYTTKKNLIGGVHKMSYNSLCNLCQNIGIDIHTVNIDNTNRWIIAFGCGNLEELMFFKSYQFKTVGVDLPSQILVAKKTHKEVDFKSLDFLIGKNLYDLKSNELEYVNWSSVKLITIMIGINMLYLSIMLHTIPVEFWSCNDSHIIFLQDVQKPSHNFLCNDGIILPKIITDYIKK